MALQSRTTRWDPDALEFIDVQAERVELTFSEFARGATLARAMLVHVRFTPADHPGALDPLYTVATDVMRHGNPWAPPPGYVAPATRRRC